jgi:hypothetical protein
LPEAVEVPQAANYYPEKAVRNTKNIPEEMNYQNYDYNYDPRYRPYYGAEYWVPMYRPVYRSREMKFKCLPFELHLSESSFHMVGCNEMSYLNSLAGSVHRMSNDRIENMKELSQHEEMYFCPVRVIRRPDPYMEEEYLIRERMYTHPSKIYKPQTVFIS